VVFGATGYVGGRLVPELLRTGHTVRAVTRDRSRLAEVPWRDDAEIATADVTDAASVAAAVVGQDVVYYLVHALYHRDFGRRDREAAGTLAEQASRAGVRRIVYLGGIVPDAPRLSPHLASRAEVGRILLDSGVPTVVLRAAVIVGSGSASFEMLRHLTERLPVMITPKWAHNRIQPIAIADVLRYLTHVDVLPDETNRGFDIGGPDVLTYLDMMRRYAVVAGLPRRMVIPVPVLTPWLSAQWVNLVTPVPRGIAVPLIESLVHEVVCRDHDIARYIPGPEGGLTGYESAIELALANEPHICRPVAGSPADSLPTDPDWSGSTVYEDIHDCHTGAERAAVWRVIESILGEHGRGICVAAWCLPGWINRMIGRTPLDRWRAERLDQPYRLRLRAEVLLPGRAWMELSTIPDQRGGAVVRLRMIFQPHGLTGHLCWKFLSPFRGMVLGGLARNIAGAAGDTR
jgi:uncharacterized protein YbjT (DUF2867 family)